MYSEIWKEDGISPVVSVILVVAIVVILSASIGLFVFDLADGTSKSSQGAFDIQIESDYTTTAQLNTLQSGEQVYVQSALGTKYNVSSVGESVNVLNLEGQEITFYGVQNNEKTLLQSTAPETGFNPDWAVDRYGTEDFVTIQAAVDNASVGDVIVVERATYNENVNVSKNVTIVAEPGTMLQDAEPNKDIIHIDAGATGFTLLNLNMNGDPELGDGHYSRHCIYTESADISVVNNNMQNCTSTDSQTGAGVYVNASNASIQQNTISNVDVGIVYAEGTQCTVMSNNKITNISTQAVFSQSDSAIHMDSNRFGASDILDSGGFTGSYKEVASNNIGGYGKSAVLRLSEGSVKECSESTVETSVSSDSIAIGNPSDPVNWFDSQIEIFINGEPVVIQPTGKHSFDIVSSASSLDSDSVFTENRVEWINESSSSADDVAYMNKSERVKFSMNTSGFDGSESVRTTLSTKSSDGGGYVPVSSSAGTQETSNIKFVQSTISTTSNPADGTGTAAPSFSTDIGSDFTAPVGSNITFLTKLEGIDSDTAVVEWDFGDGTTDSGVRTTHTYDTTGEYTVLSTTTNTSSNETAADSVTVTIVSQSQTIEDNRAPFAELTGDLSTAVGVTSNLTANESEDFDGSIEKYEWDTTDDGTFDTTGKYITFSRDVEGNYPVTLRVTDNDGKTETDTKIVRVSELNLVAEDGFEDGNDNGVDDWTISDSGFKQYSSPALADSYSGGVSRGRGVIASKQFAADGTKPDTISFYYQEEKSQYGAGVRFKNSNGNYEASFATDNPQWKVSTGSEGSTTQIGTGDYNHWTYVEYDFNWKEHTYDYTVRDTVTGNTQTGTQSLNYGTDVTDVVFRGFISGGWDSSRVSMYLDEIQVDSSLNATYAAQTTTSPSVSTTFDASGTTGPGTLTYNWDFDDGTSATGESVSHAFDSTGTYNVTLTVGSSTEPVTSTYTQTVVVDTNASETFETVLDSRWTNPINRGSKYVYNGSQVGDVRTNGNGIIGRFNLTDKSDRRVKTIEFNWLEQENSAGSGVRFQNSNGDYEAAFATSNPAWLVSTGSVGSTTQVHDGNGNYYDWIHVRYTFDWENNQYDYYIKNHDTGTTRTGTQSLNHGNNISAITINHYNTDWEYAKTRMFIDDIKVTRESK